jgi:hypothetical protein
VSNPQIGPAIAMISAPKEGMTSDSSQGLTADRILIHVDTELVAKGLLNNRMAYVAVSRGAYDAQLFTNDREKLPAVLGHDVSQHSAHVPEIKPDQTIAPQQEVFPGSTEGPRHRSRNRFLEPCLPR